MENHDNQANALKKCLFNYLYDTDKDITIESIKLMCFEQLDNGAYQSIFCTDKYKMGVLFIVVFYPNDMLVTIYEHPMTKYHCISCEFND